MIWIAVIEILLMLCNDGVLNTLIPKRPAQLSPATWPTTKHRWMFMGMFHIQYEPLDSVRWLKSRSTSASVVERVVPRLLTFGGSGRADLSP